MSLTLATATWPAQLVTVLPIAAVYAYVYSRLFRAARRKPGGAKLGISHILPFGLGLLAIVATAVPPLSSAADDLLSAHMLQHVLLADLASALLVLGLRSPLLTLGLPRAALRLLAPRGRWGRITSFLTNPFVAVGLFAAMQWTWAVPAMLQLTQSSPVLHLLQHALLFYTGVLLWWVVIDPLGQRRHRPRMQRLAVIAASRFATVAVCLPLTFMGREMFPDYAVTAARRGIDPLTDQQLAGASMCLLEILVFGIAFGLVFVDALRREDQIQRNAERAAGQPG